MVKPAIAGGRSDGLFSIAFKNALLELERGEQTSKTLLTSAGLSGLIGRLTCQCCPAPCMGRGHMDGRGNDVRSDHQQKVVDPFAKVNLRHLPG
ncbi:hypothetical protein [Rhizobium gallicum]|uniref:hypothetical protein n=1 Tax=Rhizobium gallicum TaxID=56730 RepID=UPI001EF7D641|nr:hypothetical protein [Rhizobium gallicum]ULJ74176.1 hypothetical protein L2W42_04165 [Rhizobium gallicum]